MPRKTIKPNTELPTDERTTATSMKQMPVPVVWPGELAWVAMQEKPIYCTKCNQIDGWLSGRPEEIQVKDIRIELSTTGILDEVRYNVGRRTSEKWTTLIFKTEKDCQNYIDSRQHG